jgi:hypothetical protein
MPSHARERYGNGNVPGYLIAHAEPPDYVVLDADLGAARALGSPLFTARIC